MGRSNGQKAAQKREKNAKKNSGGTAHSQLTPESKGLTLICSICKQQFPSNSSEKILTQHNDAKHKGKETIERLFPTFDKDAKKK